MQKWISRLTIVVASLMFLIILMGALVTKTDSGLGCGYEWPLCNGKFVPAYTISSFIEYSHRAVVAIFVIFLLLTTILIFRKSNHKDAKWLALGAIFFTLLQAAMGAFAVVIPQSSAILALHFGLSLLAFAFCFLLAIVYKQWGIPNNQANSGNLSPNHLITTKTYAMTRKLKIMIWAIMIFTYVVVYLGAFVRHTDSSGGCSGWPLCNGEWFPALDGATGIVFIHRLAALGLSIVICYLYYMVRSTYERSSSIYQGTQWVFILLLLQVSSGAIVTYSIGHDTFYLFAGMVHAVLITLLFGYLSFIGYLTIRSKSNY